MTKEEYSGELRYIEDCIVYDGGHAKWTVPLANVRLIAEYTNSDGPYLDDYFFVFLTATENGWHEASFYAKGREAILAALTARLSTPIECGLCDSANYKTRIVWPPHLKGQPLMDMLGPEKQTWWQKLTDSGARDIRLSTAALSVFEERAQPGGTDNSGAAPLRV